MASLAKIFDTILRGQSDTNVRFADLQRILKALSFQFRVKGDHFIYWREDIEEIINIQPLRGGKAKPYQVKQVRELMLRYTLRIKES